MTQETAIQFLIALADGDPDKLVRWVERFFKGAGFYMIPVPDWVATPSHALIELLGSTNGSGKKFRDAGVAVLERINEHPEILNDYPTSFYPDLTEFLENIPVITSPT